MIDLTCICYGVGDNNLYTIVVYKRRFVSSITMTQILGGDKTRIPPEDRVGDVFSVYGDASHWFPHGLVVYRHKSGRIAIAPIPRAGMKDLVMGSQDLFKDPLDIEDLMNLLEFMV